MQIRFVSNFSIVFTATADSPRPWRVQICQFVFARVRACWHTRNTVERKTSIRKPQRLNSHKISLASPSSHSLHLYFLCQFICQAQYSVFLRQFLLIWDSSGLFFFNFVFSTVNSKHIQYKILPITGFEPRISTVGSERSAN